jgi:hypothetical protein
MCKEVWPAAITHLHKTFVSTGKREMNTALQTLAAQYVCGEDKVWLQSDGRVNTIPLPRTF